MRIVQDLVKDDCRAPRSARLLEILRVSANFYRDWPFPEVLEVGVIKY